MEDNLTLENQRSYIIKLKDILEKHYEPIKTTDSERYVGVEIEVERAKPDKVNEIINENFIKITEDGSLRNSGLEYITCPHKSKYTINLLNHLFSLLHTKHEFSPRTSIHIHVNARDLTPKQIRALLLVYLTVERLLYNWIGNKRDQSIFCVPIIETDLATYLLNKKQYIWMKYTGINLKPMQELGTIEFRHMHGTKDIQGKIEPWLNMILCLFQFTKQHEYLDIQRRIFELNTTSNYYTFLYDIFGPLAGLLTHSNFHKDMEEGVCYIKTHSLTNTFAKKCSAIHPESPYAIKEQRNKQTTSTSPLTHTLLQTPGQYTFSQETINILLDEFTQTQPIEHTH